MTDPNNQAVKPAQSPHSEWYSRGLQAVWSLPPLSALGDLFRATYLNAIVPLFLARALTLQ